MIRTNEKHKLHKGSTKEAPPSDGTVNYANPVTRSGPEIIKLCSYSTQLSLKFQLVKKLKYWGINIIFSVIILLINVEMPTIIDN